MADLPWSFAWGVLGGFAAWLATNFVGKPFMEFLALRREIQEELTFLQNVDPPNTGTLYEFGDEAYDKELTEFNDARKKIERLASKLTALNTYFYPPVPHLLRALGFNIENATTRLRRLSGEHNYENATVLRYELEVSLRLPHLKEPFAKAVVANRKRRQKAAEQRRNVDADRSS